MIQCFLNWTYALVIHILAGNTQSNHVFSDASDSVFQAFVKLILPQI
jgi:hypothetical protein